MESLASLIVLAQKLECNPVKYQQLGLSVFSFMFILYQIDLLCQEEIKGQRGKLVALAGISEFYLT